MKVDEYRSLDHFHICVIDDLMADSHEGEPRHYYAISDLTIDAFIKQKAVWS